MSRSWAAHMLLLVATTQLGCHTVAFIMRLQAHNSNHYGGSLTIKGTPVKTTPMEVWTTNLSYTEASLIIVACREIPDKTEPLHENSADLPIATPHLVLKAG